MRKTLRSWVPADYGLVSHRIRKTYSVESEKKDAKHGCRCMKSLEFGDHRTMSFFIYASVFSMTEKLFDVDMALL